MLLVLQALSANTSGEARADGPGEHREAPASPSPRLGTPVRGGKRKGHTHDFGALARASICLEM